MGSGSLGIEARNSIAIYSLIKYNKSLITTLLLLPGARKFDACQTIRGKPLAKI